VSDRATTPQPASRLRSHALRGLESVSQATHYRMLEREMRRDAELAGDVLGSAEAALAALGPCALAAPEEAAGADAGGGGGAGDASVTAHWTALLRRFASAGDGVADAPRRRALACLCRLTLAQGAPRAQPQRRALQRSDTPRVLLRASLARQARCSTRWRSPPSCARQAPFRQRQLRLRLKARIHTHTHVHAATNANLR
jgi:hypothetical protein